MKRVRLVLLEDLTRDLDRYWNAASGTNQTFVLDSSTLHITSIADFRGRFTPQYQQGGNTMSTLVELQERREMREELRVIGTPQALADLEQLKRMQHASEQLQLRADSDPLADRTVPDNSIMFQSKSTELRPKDQACQH